MNPYELIKKKRDGRELSKGEISFLIGGFLNSRIPDYQMAAFLMAIYFSGMSIRESVDLTMAMVESMYIVKNDFEPPKWETQSEKLAF